jgi:glycosyltransferase involved in cell wall biosynthesis
MIRVLISDAGRHKFYSGYGEHSRIFALALVNAKNFKVFFMQDNLKWEYQGTYLDELKQINCIKDETECDVVLQIGTPQTFKSNFSKPCILVTQCDLSDLNSENIRIIKNSGQAVITSARSSKKVFDKYISKVYVVPLAIDSKIFRPVSRWRIEGNNKFSFIFVGSFSFRKGVDLLLQAFFEEFSHEEVNLHMHCPNSQADRVGNSIIEMSQKYNKIPMVSFTTKSLTPAWINRYYNRADAFVSFTRGEGWGLPIVEAMHCGLPIIAPMSTSMNDYLNEDISFCLKTTSKLVENIDNDFGFNFKKSHQQIHNKYYEINIQEGKKVLRYVLQNQKEAKIKGDKGRIHMTNNFSLEQVNENLVSSIINFLENK